LYRIEVTAGPGGGVKILNSPAPPGFRESVRIAEQNLYTQTKNLVGDRDPREHEFSVQMRPLDNDRSGIGLSLPVVLAMAGALLERSTKGALIVVGSMNLGGSFELLPNALAIAELAIDKQAATLLMPIAARRQLNELPDALWTRINIEFYAEAKDAFLKALVD
jgi:ATP-dependent Lon protease